MPFTSTSRVTAVRPKLGEFMKTLPPDLNLVEIRQIDANLLAQYPTPLQHYFVATRNDRVLGRVNEGTPPPWWTRILPKRIPKRIAEALRKKMGPPERVIDAIKRLDTGSAHYIISVEYTMTTDFDRSPLGITLYGNHTDRPLRFLVKEMEPAVRSLIARRIPKP
jgi:hypothetical protein